MIQCDLYAMPYQLFLCLKIHDINETVPKPKVSERKNGCPSISSHSICWFSGESFLCLTQKTMKRKFVNWIELCTPWDYEYVCEMNTIVVEVQHTELSISFRILRNIREEKWKVYGVILPFSRNLKLLVKCILYSMSL